MSLDGAPTSAFARTNLLLVASRLRRIGAALGAVLVLFATWVGWALFGKIPIYATSSQARLESSTFPFPIEMPVAGVTVSCNLALAAQVEKGDVLIELDSRAFQLQKGELEAQLRADATAIDALSFQLDASTRAREAVATLTKEAIAAGNAKVAASRAMAAYKDKEQGIVAKLRGAELTSELDSIKSEGEAKSLNAQLVAVAAQAALESTNETVSLRDRDTQIASLTKTLSDARSLKDVHAAQLQQTEYEIERRRVRAPASGSLAEITPCATGMSVAAGARVATLLPPAEVRVVATFRPEDAVGRVSPSKPAILRIDNFPWTQFGTVDAIVDRVGSEPRDGLIRVELRITRPNPAIPVLHGLTGVADIEVERPSPAKLLLRMAGQLLDPPRAALSGTQRPF